MQRVGNSRPTFLQRVGPNPRFEAKGLDKKAEARADAGRPAPEKAGLEARFGAKDADVGAIQAAIRALPEFQAKSLERSQATFFKLLDRALSGLDPDARKTAGAEQVGAFRELLESTPAPLRLGAAQASLALFDARVRLAEAGRLTGGADARAGAFASAADVVKSFLDESEGRDGLQHALAVLPQWAENLGRDAPRLDAKGWASLVGAAASAIGNSACASGFEPAALTEATIALDAQREKAPEDPKAALAAFSKAATRERTKAGKALAAELPAAAEVANRPEAVEDAVAALRDAMTRCALGAGGEGEALSQSLTALAQKLDKLAVHPQHAEGQAQLLSSVASLLEAHAGSAAAPALIQLFAEPRLDLARAGQNAQARELFQKAAEGAEAPLAQTLIEAVALLRNQRFQNDANAQAAFERLGALPPTLSLRVGAHLARGGVAQVIEAGTVDALVALAEHGAAHGLDARLESGMTRAAQIAGQLGRYNQLAAARQELIPALTQAGLDPAQDAAQTQAVLQMMQTIRQYLPRVEVSGLLERSRHGASLLDLADPKAGWAQAPAQRLTQLLNGARNTVDEKEQTEIAQIAIALSNEVCRIHGGQNLHGNRIQQDFAASLKNPRSLKSQIGQGSMLAVRARGHSVPTFLESHPHLPIDLAFTAGQHLMPGAIAWLSERAEKTRGLATLRNLRDFVFGCVEANRLDLIETLREADVTSKAVTRVIDEVANAYRGGQAQNLPFDAIIVGILEGRDAVADIAADKARQTLQDLALHDLVEGKVDPAGANEIASQAENLSDLLGQLQPGFKSSLDGEIDYGALRPIFMESLKAVAEGNWPAAKYTGEVAERLLAGCSEAQREAWITTSVTSGAPGAKKAEPNAKTDDAALLVRGVARAVEARIELEAPGFAGRAIDAKTVEALEKKLGATLDALRDVPKDDVAARRELGAEAGALRRDLRLAAFAVAVSEADQPGVEAAQLLSATRAPLREAGAELRREGHSDLWAATMDALSVADALGAPSEKSRHYASDEDGFAALIGSHQSGCLSKGDKRRRWGLVGAVADANIKMLRVHRDGKQVYRTFLKLFDVKLPNYEGPALYVDNPRPDGGGNAADLELLYRHLLEKGETLGVPVMAQANLQKYAQEKGWQGAQQNVQLSVDDGHTGYMHSDHLFGGKGAIRASRGNNPKWVTSKSMYVASPPAKEKA